MRTLIFLTALFFCGCEYASPVVGVIGHGLGAYQRNELISKASEIGDTTAHNNAMLLGLCNKFEVDTCSLKQPASTPVEKPEDGEHDDLIKTVTGALTALFGVGAGAWIRNGIKKAATDKRVQELIEKAAKEKLG